MESILGNNALIADNYTFVFSFSQSTIVVGRRTRRRHGETFSSRLTLAAAAAGGTTRLQ